MSQPRGGHAFRLTRCRRRQEFNEASVRLWELQRGEFSPGNPAERRAGQIFVRRRALPKVQIDLTVRVVPRQPFEQPLRLDDEARLFMALANGTGLRRFPRLAFSTRELGVSGERNALRSNADEETTVVLDNGNADEGACSHGGMAGAGGAFAGCPRSSNVSESAPSHSIDMLWGVLPQRPPRSDLLRGLTPPRSPYDCSAKSCGGAPMM